jgi:uncharacterized protein YndB with AHSA1/START domain
MQSAKNDTANRELRFSRWLDAPLSLVWKIWTTPEHIKWWWGPKDFSNTILKMDVKTGGEWLLIMHGPDGRNYEIKSIFREVIKHKKIIYEQLTVFQYIAIIEFESSNNKTLINWTMQFASMETMQEAIKTYGVSVGFDQNVERMIDYLTKTMK